MDQELRAFLGGTLFDLLVAFIQIWHSNPPLPGPCTLAITYILHNIFEATQPLGKNTDKGSLERCIFIFLSLFKIFKNYLSVFYLFNLCRSHPTRQKYRTISRHTAQLPFGNDFGAW